MQKYEKPPEIARYFSVFSLLSILFTVYDRTAFYRAPHEKGTFFSLFWKTRMDNCAPPKSFCENCIGGGDFFAVFFLRQNAR